MAEWEKFYKDKYQKVKESQFVSFHGGWDPKLDDPILIHELNLAIAASKNNKAAGPDGIKNEFLKSIPQNQKEILLDIFNKALNGSAFPYEWSECYVSHIYKKGDAKHPTNYRPIALLNHSCKLFT